MNSFCPVCRAEVQMGEATCPQCGFKLLGATQEFKPLAFDEAEREKRARGDRSATLRVVRGPQAGVSFKLEGDVLTIGRSPHCSIFLNDMTVSRMHATLNRESTCYVITDDNSFNGVWVNNQIVQSKALSSGDLIQIGAFCLCYEEAAL